jgi:hypothetical protein
MSVRGCLIGIGILIDIDIVIGIGIRIRIRIRAVAGFSRLQVCTSVCKRAGTRAGFMC